MSTEYSEDTLVEQPAIGIFEGLGWQAVNCFRETFGERGTLGRETSGEVVLLRRLRGALAKLNPKAPPEALALAVEELVRDRSAMAPAQANREVYGLLKDGVRVETTRRGAAEADPETVTVRVIDWEHPGENDFLLASQFWIAGDLHRRRTDLVGFVNGIPLVFVELKATHRRLELAFRKNLTDYKHTIPHLFWYNALVLLSNGSKSRLGTLTSEWEHFADWKKVARERDTGVVSLDTMIRATCEPGRLLDLVENFTLYREDRDGLAKLVARNHQYLGANAAVQAVRRIEQNRGRLGVFWHTQGSGKSYSMIFFSQKVLRALPGNWTFLVVTDRDDLDQQIYKTFARCGAVTEPHVRARSGKELQRLLQEDHRHVFTLIQKFRTRKGERYPVLSTRSDLIVITDEAHRTQYDTFALNMRNALPNAAFIGFTGTPLIAGEEKTREVFGDYVSVYDHQQSVDDGATVRLFYENRIPELQLQDRDLNEKMNNLLEAAELSPREERRLEREFAREYQLITRNERLETIAEDVVSHFLGRGFQGKAMMICVDKATAVKMHDKVRTHWARAVETARLAVATAADLAERERREARLRYLDETDLAVVVSQEQNEIEELKAKGLDIRPHRKRMVKEDLDEKFKDPDDPLRLVFVCAMWITGFDVPCCSTIYLDKPMRNHTLMQTMARANRVFPNKESGLIVDYVGIFRNLQKALAIYVPTGPGGGGEPPIQEKGALVAELRRRLAAAEAYGTGLGIDLGTLRQAEGLEKVGLLDDAVEAVLASEETKQTFLAQASLIDRLFTAILPDPAANEFASGRALLHVLAEMVRAETGEDDRDLADVKAEAEVLLDRAIAAWSYEIRQPPGRYADRFLDLSRIDFDALAERFARDQKRSDVEKLRRLVEAKCLALAQQNRTRLDYVERFEQMIADYNAGSTNVETLFQHLVKLAKDLTAEEQRHIAEQLSEEELAVFDLLIKPAPELTAKERSAVKAVARELLATLKREKLVLDWHKRQQSRAAVRLTIEQLLDHLPRRYAPELYRSKCEAVYGHVYDAYLGQGRSAYSAAS